MLKSIPKKPARIAIVLPIDGNAAKREEMIKRSGRTTVPQIFIDAQHIGGCDDLYALDARGGLDPLLK